jgi:hypothetical protein
MENPQQPTAEITEPSIEDAVEPPREVESQNKRALAMMTLESVAQRAAKRPEPLHIKNIPKLHLGMLKLDKELSALRLSASARESLERRKAINFEEEDSEYEEALTDRSVDTILTRSNRDELSKSVITQLDRLDFRKSVEGQCAMLFAEYHELSTKAQKICDSGETVLDVSLLKLGDRHIESLVEGLRKISPESSSILHVSVRDNRLSDDGET